MSTPHHPLRARAEGTSEQDQLEETLAVLEALCSEPLTADKVTEAIHRDPESRTDRMSVTKRLTHLCSRRAAREMVVRAGPAPSTGEALRIWEASSVEGVPMVLVATRVQRPVEYVRARINDDTQAARRSATKREPALARAWVLTDTGAEILRDSA